MYGGKEGVSFCFWERLYKTKKLELEQSQLQFVISNTKRST